MSWHSLALILVIHAVALISPGPDFAIVTRLSIVSGRRAGFWAAGGVSAAIGVYVLVCALGLSLVISALPGLSSILTIVGATYLAWLGIQCLRSKGQMPSIAPGKAPGKAFLTGFFTNLLNPKAMLYFSSVLSQVITPHMDASHIFMLWAFLVSESLLWFGLVATMFSSAQVIKWLRGHLVWFDRAIGAILIGLAIKVASS